MTYKQTILNKADVFIRKWTLRLIMTPINAFMVQRKSGVYFSRLDIEEESILPLKLIFKNSCGDGLEITWGRAELTTNGIKYVKCGFSKILIYK